jgi:L-fuconolactonase
MAMDHNTWLDQVKEDPIDAQMPIVDPHHHLWDYPNSRYMVEELLADADSGHNIVQTVFVECLSKYRPDGPPEMRPVGETEFVRRVTEAPAGMDSGATRVAAGIVGFADLTLGTAVKPVLEAHIAAGGGRFRGIRHAASWIAGDEINNAHTHPPQGLLLNSHFREGFACLYGYGLSFDAWLYHPQISELADLARAFPETQIILDHVGGVLGIGPFAGRRDSVLAQWQQDMAQLARCKNVVVKLGGLGMKLCGFDWHRRKKPPTSEVLAEAFAPYFHHCIETFGVKRCMFESNFPVDKPSCAYGILWNAFKRMTRNLTPNERTALFHDNAVRVYRLA